MRQILVLLTLTFSLLAGVGKVTAVKGEAYLKRADATSVVTKGMELEEKDSIETGANARVQIIFNDETVISLGKKTLFSIEEFLFDEKNAKANFNVAKGFFKSMTGQIGKIAPDKFKVKVKTSTIGIRGTHFMGLIEDDKETIGCTDGAISVTAMGETVDLFAGEMVTVMAGMVPSAPVPLDMKRLQDAGSSPLVSALKEKIGQIKLKAGAIQFDREDIMAVLKDIAQVEEDDLRRGLEDELNDQLNAAFKAGLFEKFNKTDASDNYDTGYAGADSGYTPLTWGFVTYDEPVQSGSFLSRINEAVPIQTYYEVQGGGAPAFTSPSTVSGFMGDSTTPHWDGSGGSRKVMTFDGGVLAVSDTNTFTTTPEFPADYDLSRFSAIAPDAVNNQISMTVDFGNRVWYSIMKFDIENAATGETETYTLIFDSMGSNAVNTTGLNKYGIYYEQDSQTISTLDAYTWRYYGENIEQIGGNFNLIREDGSLIAGSMILNNSSSSDLSAQNVGTVAGFDWGYWAEDAALTNPRGAWITPLGISQTDTTVIDGYITNSVTASYSGSVYGTVHDPFVGSSALMQNGSVSMDFDFSNQTMDGAIAFEAGSEQWQTAISGAPVATGGFTFNQTHITNGTAADQTVIMTEGSGKFYGADADYTGGGFEMMSGTGKVAIGAFGATKQ